jgi:midasin
MNLAQQSVLEGLNAILDHRRTVYIPELNQEFPCHPDFFVFACQNPSASIGGRKSLPKSFLNRFNKIYLEDLTQGDYQVILSRAMQEDEVLRTHLGVEALLDLTRVLQPNSSEGAVNLRDLNRLLCLYKLFMNQTNGDHDAALAQCLAVSYNQKSDMSYDRLERSGLFNDFETAKAVFSSIIQLKIDFSSNLTFSSAKPTTLKTSLDLSSTALFTRDLLGL